MADCLAAVITAFNQPLELRRLPFPELEPASALIKVDAATLCGTDAHRWLGHMAERTPFIPGHETTGTIVEMRGELFGALHEPLRVGDRVIASYPFCGACYYCTIARQPTLCPSGVSFGHQPADQPPYLLGGCAEYHYLPPRSGFVRVPDEVSAPLAASAACALRTVVHGFEQLGAIASHETVLVQGAGPLGLYSVAMARDHGARQVLVIGAPKARLEVAKSWGADAVLDLDECPEVKQRRAWALDHSAGRGPDIVIQCAASSAVGEGLEILRPGGRYVSIGIGGPPSVAIPVDIFRKQVQIKAVFMAEQRHFYEALQFLATRRQHFPFDRIISGTYTLDRTTDALRAMAEFREVKPLILPRVAN